MLSLLKRLLAPAPAPLDKIDARLALSALLVRVARTDNQYDMAEATEITRILMERYTLDRQSAEDLRTEAEAIESQAPDTVRFTRAIKNVVTYDHRTEVVEMLWQVVLADGCRDDAENSLMRLVVNLLGVNDRDSAMARHKVEARNS